MTWLGDDGRLAAGREVWWTPPGMKPIVGGNLFPPEERFGQAGFQERALTNRRRLGGKDDKIVEQGGKIVRRCVNLQSATTAGRKDDCKIFDAAYRQLDPLVRLRKAVLETARSFRAPATLETS